MIFSVATTIKIQFFCAAYLFSFYWNPKSDKSEGTQIENC